MKSKDEIVPVNIFTGNISEAGMVKNLLENDGIESFLRDEFTGTIAPWYISPGSWGSVTIVVSNKDYEKARQIVEQYEKKIHPED